MRIPPIGSNSPVVQIQRPDRPSVEGVGDGLSFDNTIKKAVAEVNRLQSDADQAAIRVASGDSQEVHSAMIAMQKAKLALDLTIQVRNKVIEAYQEIMRMQV